MTVSYTHLISDSFLIHLFEPFSQESIGTTAQYGGSGLGLSISKNIIDMMGGKITVRSIKGIGSEFTVDVQLGITEEELLRHNRKKALPNFSALKTLVVDDDVAVCESAVATLKEMGITAKWVDSGRKAIEGVQSMWDTGKHYDMILIDWKMPDIDGIETARRIRAKMCIRDSHYAMGLVEAEDQEERRRIQEFLLSTAHRCGLVSAFDTAERYLNPVSYTHRDVYKRQSKGRRPTNRWR